MVSCTEFLPALFAFLFVPTASATPWPSTFQLNTHRTHYFSADRGLKLEAFHPESIFEASFYLFRFGVKGVDPLPSYRQYPRDIPDIGSTALSFLASKLGISTDNILLRAIARGQVAQYVFVAQQINGVPIANAVANIAFNSNGMVSSLSSSFVKLYINPSVSVGDATATAEQALKGTYNGHNTTLEFVVQSNGYAALSHVIQIQNDTAGTWYEAFIDAHNNTLLSVTDFVARSSYRVLPIHEQDPTQGFQTVIDPQDMSASPNGWHQEFSTTTNLTAPNNFNNGGEGFDRILVSVQDDSGINDAVFATPPEGLTSAQPRRDSALQNDLVIHECQHGASNRMTGGGTARCYQTSEAAGVAEGYADAMADWVSQGSTTADYVFGQYVSKGSTGLRNYAYSTSDVTNPLRYSSLKGMTDAHDMGEVWANTLHNVYAALVIAKGWSTNALTDPTTNEGNVVWLHLFIDALLLQPCNPTCEDFSFGPYSTVFSCVETDTEWTVLNARDAWIQADANRYEGAHTCLLWATFASRGFGVNATNFVDDVSYPPDCNC
ncbi:Fungalysin metallopeptidase-domain-containing protein [Lactarius pseudohatsudake]|nr:Fungalysin metallopeptidase-domain-containing protein [Lactarius pseudohatsudake]